MSVYEKIQKIKTELLKCNLKKSGKNKYAEFDYYELSDIMPDIIRLCDKYKICTVINFFENHAELQAVDFEKSEEKIVIQCPVAEIQIRGANALQALGGIQTYVRRYLFMAMFDITENDQFDAVSGKSEKTEDYRCIDCGTKFQKYTDKNGTKYSPKMVYSIAKRRSPDGEARCGSCLKKFTENSKSEDKNNE